jgi:hypothetical protein
MHQQQWQQGRMQQQGTAHISGKNQLQTQFLQASNAIAV